MRYKKIKIHTNYFKVTNIHVKCSKLLNNLLRLFTITACNNILLLTIELILYKILFLKSDDDE